MQQVRNKRSNGLCFPFYRRLNPSKILMFEREKKKVNNNVRLILIFYYKFFFFFINFRFSIF